MSKVKLLILIAIVVVSISAAFIATNMLFKGSKTNPGYDKPYLIVHYWRSSIIMEIVIPENYLDLNYSIESLRLRYGNLGFEIPINLTTLMPNDKYVRVGLIIPNPKYIPKHTNAMIIIEVGEFLRPISIERFSTVLPQSLLLYNETISSLEKLIDEVYAHYSIIENKSIHITKNITSLRINGKFFPDLLSITIPLSTIYEWVSERSFIQVIVIYFIDNEILYNVSITNIIGVGFGDELYAPWIKEISIYKGLIKTSGMDKSVERGLRAPLPEFYKALQYFNNKFDKLVIQWLVEGSIFINRTIYVYVIEFPSPSAELIVKFMNGKTKVIPLSVFMEGVFIDKLRYILVEELALKLKLKS